ncbi:Glycosyl transferase, group 1 family protein [Candidatus Defluviicoccus seviourii]|uniref:Glycosyl transferase, group 1 family protein n=1 Tax=Candidatus Defluviicoccus seviourii TaxID=2565273 RepID=A0A564WFK6_9PROT|nr:Glycosyl transferase, group 1 family protein [Candidatus Defluviicoccus seviourii]
MAKMYEFFKHESRGSLKVLYLYAEVMSYTLATLRALADKDVELHVVHWDTRKLTPFEIGSIPGATFYPRSKMSLQHMQDLVRQISFNAVVVSGWVDKDYLSIARVLRRKNVAVVCGFDDQWHGDTKQQLAAVLGGIRFFHRYFSHAWVAGAPQYAYARRLGFDHREIIYDLYSADLNLFAEDYFRIHAEKENSYPHKFLFVGRLHEVKGIMSLVSAWKTIRHECRDWGVCMIGNGPLRDKLNGVSEGIVCKDFVQPGLLPNEVAAAGCLVLPSRSEPWGVVLHEFAAAGLPIICSDVCGAASAFVVDGWNGYTFRSLDADALAEKMLKIIETDDATLLEMGRRSHQLAGKITPETSAANLLSVAHR